MDYNRFLYAGRLTKEVDCKTTANGITVAKFDVASNRVYVKGDKKTESVCFLPVTCFGKVAESCSKYLSKGSGVFIEGYMELQRWTDNATGEKRQKISFIAGNVQFIGSKKSESEASSKAPESQKKEPF